MEPDKDDLFDVDAGVAEIASGLGLGIEPDEPIEDEAIEAPVEAPVVRAAPKSWAKETHEQWSKLDPRVQDQIEKREQDFHAGLEQYKEYNTFGKQMREVFTPYKALLESQGVDEAKAAQYLLNAHYRLINLPAEQKLSYLDSIARNYGINLGLQQQAPVDPRYQQLESTVQQLTSAMTQQYQRQYQEKYTQTSNDVGAFVDAKDEKGNKIHPYFDEVADDILPFLNAGHSLNDAYDKAVWANPVTRAKEQARLKTETENALRGRSKQEVEKARQASSTNVRSRDTRKTPTEPLGKMDDTMRATLDEIKARAH